MEPMGTIQEWVDGFEQELQVRFKNKKLRVHVIDHSNTTADDIMELVCYLSGISKKVLLYKAKGSRIISDTRMVAMHFVLKCTNLKPREVGKLFNRDRTTVLHAVKTISHRIDTNDFIVTNLMEQVNRQLLKKQSKQHNENLI